jgi:hypothetical protein
LIPRCPQVQVLHERLSNILDREKGFLATAQRVVPTIHFLDSAGQIAETGLLNFGSDSERRIALRRIHKRARKEQPAAVVFVCGVNIRNAATEKIELEAIEVMLYCPDGQVAYRCPYSREAGKTTFLPTELILPGSSTPPSDWFWPWWKKSA